jgi:type II secretory pathway component PulJ
MSSVRRRRGFALLEAFVACAMSALLVYVVAEMWGALNRAAVQAVARCGLIREADLALTRLADDLRGYASARPDTRLLIADIDALQIVQADRTVSYSVQGGRLVREDTAVPDVAEVVAWSVQGLQTTRVVADGPLYEFRITLGSAVVENRSTGQTLSRVFTLAALLPLRRNPVADGPESPWCSWSWRPP